MSPIFVVRKQVHGRLTAFPTLDPSSMFSEVAMLIIGPQMAPVPILFSDFLNGSTAYTLPLSTTQVALSSCLFSRVACLKLIFLR